MTAQQQIIDPRRHLNIGRQPVLDQGIGAIGGQGQTGGTLGAGAGGANPATVGAGAGATGTGGTRVNTTTAATRDAADPTGSVAAGYPAGWGRTATGWAPPGHPDIIAVGAGSGSGTGAGTGSSGAGTTGTGAGTNTQTVAGAFQNALLQRLNANPAQLNAQNPEIRGSINANRVAEQRAMERARAQMAESATSQGLDRNAFDTGLTGLNQSRAEREGAFEGNAIMQLGNRQAQELSQAIQIAAAQGDNQAARELQERLAQLQATLSREEIGLRGRLGSQELELRNRLGSGQLNLGLLGLLQGGQQFNQNLGAQLGQFGAGLNQQALLQMLGML